MLKKNLTAIALLLAAFGAQAQSTPAKLELANRIVKLQQPNIESMARALATQPAADMLDRAGAALPERVPAEKREAVAKGIQADAKKYVDEAVPLVSDRAVKLAPTTIAPLLAEKFTEEELRLIATTMESPAWNKFQQTAGEMQKVLVDKLVADTSPAIEPKLKALEQSIGKRLGVEPTAAPAKASKPAGK